MTASRRQRQQCPTKELQKAKDPAVASRSTNRAALEARFAKIVAIAAGVVAVLHGEGGIEKAGVRFTEYPRSAFETAVAALAAVIERLPEVAVVQKTAPRKTSSFIIIFLNWRPRLQLPARHVTFHFVDCVFDVAVRLLNSADDIFHAADDVLHAVDDLVHVVGDFVDAADNVANDV